jgi:prefoldin subunit 5
MNYDEKLAELTKNFDSKQKEIEGLRNRLNQVLEEATEIRGAYKFVEQLKKEVENLNTVTKDKDSEPKKTE